VGFGQLLIVDFESPTLHSRSANLVNSGGDGGVLKTGTECSLTGRVLALVSGEDTTKVNFLDGFSGQVGLLDSSCMTNIKIKKHEYDKSAISLWPG
jgi:hypothetical protein